MKLHLLSLLLFLRFWSAVGQEQLSTGELHNVEKIGHLNGWVNNPSPVPQSDSMFTVLGRWAWGPCEAVDARGQYVYIGNGPTFNVLDMANPAAPQIVGEYLTNGYVTDIQIRDTLAFVATGAGLLILNVSSPTNPTRVGDVSLGGGSIRVAPVDSFAYVTSADGVMSVVDVSTPTSPFLRGSLVLPGEFALCLAASGRYAYTDNQDDPDFSVVDATDPDNPQRVSLNVPVSTAFSATVRDTFLYVGTYTQFQIYSIRNPLSPYLLGALSVDTLIIGIAIDDSVAYLSTHPGILSVEISNPANPVQRGWVEQPYLTSYGRHGIAAENGRVYGSFYTGLLSIDSAEPDSLRPLSHFATGGWAGRMEIQGEYAYVASGPAGLWILNITEPRHPQPVANVNANGWTSDVKVSGDYAYIVNWARTELDPPGSLGLWVIDISDPLHPSVRSHHPGIARWSPNYVHPNTLANTSNLVFMTQPGGGPTLEIIDVSDPLQPFTRGVFTMLFSGYVTDVQDSIAFIATPNGGVRLINVADPSSPQEIGSILNSAIGVLVRDNKAFVVADSLFIFDVSNPLVPALLGTGPRGVSGATSFDLTISKDNLYLAELDLVATDVSNVSNPRVEWTFYSYSWARGVASRNDLVLLGDQTQGVWLIRNDRVTTVTDDRRTHKESRDQTFRVFPNPILAGERIRLSLPQGANTTIELINVLGEQVLSFSIGTTDNGIYELPTDVSALAAGVYFFKLTSERESFVRKVLVIR